MQSFSYEAAARFFSSIRDLHITSDIVGYMR